MQCLLNNVGVFALESETHNTYCELDIYAYGEGIHETNDFFIKINADKKVEWVVSRVCDHANGKLFQTHCKSMARCPFHGWTLDLNKLQYTNVQVFKEKIAFSQIDNKLFIKNNQLAIKVPSHLKTAAYKEISIRFLAHASLAITIDGFTIVTDPWLIGPCCMTGWWHKVVPKADAFDILSKADLVYISHNHPDHMHLETLTILQKQRPHMPIMVPAFTTESVIRPLEKLGFKNIIPLTFNQLFKVADKNILLAMFQSGDFRDDSGLFFSSGDFQALLTVDAAALNRMILPRNIDFLATAFAGGSSGYPWCFEHYSMEKRQEIAEKSKRGMVKLVLDYIRVIKPAVYMPYAGYFSEEAPRDDFIKKNNIKNSVTEIKTHVAKMAPHIHFIDPTVTDNIYFQVNKELIKKNSKKEALYNLNQTYIDKYIDHEKIEQLDFNLDKVISYFKQSQFQDELIVYLMLTDDSFNSHVEGLKIDFNQPQIQIDKMNIQTLQADYAQVSRVRKKLIKVRLPAFYRVITQKLSWENLSLGFQCRIFRHPEIYNSKFWYHFSNIYTDFNSFPPSMSA